MESGEGQADRGEVFSAGLSGSRCASRNFSICLDCRTTHLETPLIGIVSRFADQKGFDLIGGKKRTS